MANKKSKSKKEAVKKSGRGKASAKKVKAKSAAPAITRVENYSFDERFYQRLNKDGKHEFLPSVTYVLGCAYPQDFGLAQWRGDVGNRRADEILEETAAEGSFVHQAIEQLLLGGKVESLLINKNFSPRRSLKIKRCLKAFLDWHVEFKPLVISSEYTLWNDKDGYAGTADLLCKIDGKTILVDFKTSKTIHASHKAQIAAYALAEETPADSIAILHLGNTTKKKYSFIVLDPEERAQSEKEFRLALQMFQTIHPNAAPTEETFPDTFILKV